MALAVRAARSMGWGVFVAALCLVPAVRGDDPPALPGPAPRPRAAGADALAANEACAGCHPDEAREWRGSMHQQAWQDRVFLSAYALEPLPFCRGCHAPESDPAASPSAAARSVGVGCVTCHLEGERVVAARRSGNAAPHPVFADARFATSAACEGCHQFAFPELPPTVAMQDTGREHSASPHAAEPCAKCHMPVAFGPNGKHRSHDFAVFGRPEMIRRAIGVDAARSDANAITLELTETGAGHAVPTGDMFRRLEARAVALADGKPVASARPAVLARRFSRIPSPHGGTPLRVPVGDDRVPASGAVREVRLPFGESVEGRTVRWEVVYRRMDPSMAALFGVDLDAEEIVLASGEIAPLRVR